MVGLSDQPAPAEQHRLDLHRDVRVAVRALSDVALGQSKWRSMASLISNVPKFVGHNMFRHRLTSRRLRLVLQLASSAFI